MSCEQREKKFRECMMGAGIPTSQSLGGYFAGFVTPDHSQERPQRNFKSLLGREAVPGYKLHRRKKRIPRLDVPTTLAESLAIGFLMGRGKLGGIVTSGMVAALTKTIYAGRRPVPLSEAVPGGRVLLKKKSWYCVETVETPDGKLAKVRPLKGKGKNTAFVYVDTTSGKPISQRRYEEAVYLAQGKRQQLPLNRPLPVRPLSEAVPGDRIQVPDNPEFGPLAGHEMILQRRDGSVLLAVAELVDGEGTVSAMMTDNGQALSVLMPFEQPGGREVMSLPISQAELDEDMQPSIDEYMGSAQEEVGSTSEVSATEQDIAEVGNNISPEQELAGEETFEAELSNLDVEKEDQSGAISISELSDSLTTVTEASTASTAVVGTLIFQDGEMAIVTRIDADGTCYARTLVNEREIEVMAPGNYVPDSITSSNPQSPVYQCGQQLLTSDGDRDDKNDEVPVGD